MSVPLGREWLCSTTTPRNLRLTLFRTTAPPTDFATTKPTRVPAWSATGRQCTTSVPRPARTPLRIVSAKSSDRRIRRAAGSTRNDQADSSSRPLRRRAARIARPARVRMRSRKPCVLARRRLFGWKVRFDTSDSTRLVQVTAGTADSRCPFRSPVVASGATAAAERRSARRAGTLTGAERTAVPRYAAESGRSNLRRCEPGHQRAANRSPPARPRRATANPPG